MPTMGFRISLCEAAARPADELTSIFSEGERGARMTRGMMMPERSRSIIYFPNPAGHFTGAPWDQIHLFGTFELKNCVRG